MRRYLLVLIGNGVSKKIQRKCGNEDIFEKEHAYRV